MDVLGSAVDEVEPAGATCIPASRRRTCSVSAAASAAVPRHAFPEHAEGVGADEAVRVPAADHPGLPHGGMLAQAAPRLPPAIPRPPPTFSIVVAAALEK